jgi:hypothetical protein
MIKLGSFNQNNLSAGFFIAYNLETRKIVYRNAAIGAMLVEELRQGPCFNKKKLHPPQDGPEFFQFFRLQDEVSI